MIKKLYRKVFPNPYVKALEAALTELKKWPVDRTEYGLCYIITRASVLKELRSVIPGKTRQRHETLREALREKLTTGFYSIKEEGYLTFIYQAMYNKDMDELASSLLVMHRSGPRRYDLRPTLEEWLRNPYNQHRVRNERILVLQKLIRDFSK